METTLRPITDTAREAHEKATQQMLAASNAAHPLRQDHGAAALHRDAKQMFQNMGQTLVPELLRELDEARRLLSQRAAPAAAPEIGNDQIKELTGLARNGGWTSGTLVAYFRSLLDAYNRANKVYNDLFTLARENGMGDKTTVSLFLRWLVGDYKRRINVLHNEREKLLGRGGAPGVSGMLDKWCSGDEMRYVEVSHGRRSKFMLTLWKINLNGQDVKIGHGEGDTLEEAMQRAQGVIIL